MKVFFTVVDTDEAKAKTALQTIEVKLNQTWFSIKKLTDLPELKFIMALDDTAFTFDVWLTVPDEIQGLRFTNNATTVVTVTFEILTQHVNSTFKGFLETTINEFIAGKSYLIPFTAGAVTDIMPNSQLFPIEQASTDSVFIGTHYRYEASETKSVRGGTGFTGIVYDTNVQAAISEVYRKSVKEEERQASFTAHAAGVPHLAAAAVNQIRSRRIG